MEDPVFKQLKRSITTENKQLITFLCEQYAEKLTEAVRFINWQTLCTSSISL